MKALALPIAALACAAIGAAAAAAQLSTVPPPATIPVAGSGTSTGTVSGVVLDGTTNQPIAGAIVWLGRDGRGAAASQGRQVTDRQGRFVFVEVSPAARLTIAASRPGYLDSSMDRSTGAGPNSFALAEGQWLGDVRLRLWRPASISGTVRDETGEAVVGVLVRAYAKLRMAGRDQLAAALSATTDDRGQYRIGGLIPGRYVVAVPSVQVSVPASLTDDRLFGRGGPGAAKVAAFSVDALVRLIPGPYPVPPPAEDGRALAYPIAFHPNAAAVSDAATLDLQHGDERTGADVTLAPSPTATITGYVDGPEEGRAGLTLRLLSPGMSGLGMGSETATALVAADGTFRFANIPLGAYLIELGNSFGQYRFGRQDLTDFQRLRFPGQTGSASNTGDIDAVPGASFTSTTVGAADMYALPSPVTVGPTGVSDIVLTLRPAAVLSGTVRLEVDNKAPAPPPFVVVVAEPADGSANAGGRSTINRDDPSNPFRIERLLPTRYVLRSGVATWIIKNVTVGGRDHTDVPIDATSPTSIGDIVVTLSNMGGTVGGTVRDTQGTPAGAVTVVIFPTDRALWLNFGRSSPRLKSAVTSDAGAYRINNLPGGEYLAAVIPATRATDWRDPDLLDTLSASASRISLAWGGHLTEELTTNAR